MAKMSERVVAVLQELRSSGQDDRIEQLIEELAASGEWRAIPSLAGMAVDTRKPHIAATAARAIASLVAGTPVVELPALDHALRTGVPWHAHERNPWHGLAPDALIRWHANRQPPIVLRLAMCHPSGHVREAAIRLAAAAADGHELPFLLIRTNDWVRPVRAAAIAAVRPRIDTRGADALVAAIALVDRMRAWAARDQVRLLDEIDDLLGSPAAQTALERGLASPDPRVRRGVLRRALASESMRQRVLVRALGDREPMIRRWVVDKMWERPGPELDALVPRLLADRAGEIRQRALGIASTRGLHFDRDAMLGDVFAGVRRLAQSIARSHGVDAAAFYRARLGSASGRRLAATIAGLGETGTASDEPLVRAFLAHATRRIRLAALDAAIALGATDRLALCLAAFADPSPCLSHRARDLLAGTPVSIDRLWQAFGGAPEHARVDILRVIRTLDFWQRVPYLLRAARDESPTVSRQALAFLGSWLERQNRCFVAPMAADADAIRALLGHDAVPARVRSEIGAILRARMRGG